MNRTQGTEVPVALGNWIGISVMTIIASQKTDISTCISSWALYSFQFRLSYSENRLNWWLNSRAQQILSSGFRLMRMRTMMIDEDALALLEPAFEWCESAGNRSERDWAILLHGKSIMNKRSRCGKYLAPERKEFARVRAAGSPPHHSVLFSPDFTMFPLRKRLFPLNRFDSSWFIAVGKARN